PASWLYFGGSLACRWGTCHEKLVSVGNRPMLSLSSLYQTLHKGIPWTLKQRGMVHLVVDLIGPFTQKGIEIGEGPHRLVAMVNLFCELAWTFGGLSIAKEIVDKLGIRCAKEAFNDGAK